MKLYTEEQVKDLLDKMEVIYSLKELTPIELPSDEEIEKYDDGSTKLNTRTYYDAFQDGAKWMKEQILNQNKQNTNTSFTPHNANAVAEYNEGLKNFTPNN